MVKYICWSKDEENLKRATSGGVMYEFAKFVINDLNGHVVGVDKEGNWDIVSTLKEVEKFQGSKYYEGNPSSWKTMYNKLKYKRNTILFVGKPCDVTLLKTVTDKKNILYVTLKCHGLPKEGKFDRCNAKLAGWSNSWVGLPKKYLNSKNLCSVCKNCNISRFNGDLTIGDAWDAPKHLWNEYGTSEVNVLTMAGAYVFMNSDLVKHSLSEFEDNKKIALLDVHDHHNFGNCLIAAEFVKAVREQKPDQNFVFIERRRDYAYKKMEELTGIKKDEGIDYRSISLLDNKPSTLLKTWFDLSVIKDCDTVVILGGDTFSYPHWRYRWTYWLLYLYMLQRAGKKVFFFGNTIGNIPFYAKWLFKKILNNTPKIYLRDKWSANQLAEIGVNIDKIYVMPDMIFNIEQSNPKKVYPCIFVPSGDFETFGKTLPEYMVMLFKMILKIKQQKGQVIIMPHSTDELEKGIARTLAVQAECPLVTPRNPTEAREFLGKSRLNICMRMHSALQSVITNSAYALIGNPRNSHKMKAVFEEKAIDNGFNKTAIYLAIRDFLSQRL